MNTKKMSEILDYLDLEDAAEFGKYLSKLNVSRLLNDYEKIKENSNVEKAIDLLSEILEEAKKNTHITAKKQKELYDELLLDDDLIEFLSTTDINTKFIEILKNTLNDSEDSQESDLDEEKRREKELKRMVKDAISKFSIKGTVEEEYNKMLEYSKDSSKIDIDYKNKFIDNKHYKFYKYLLDKFVDPDVQGIPLYTPEEEKNVFNKYNYLMMKLELHIYANQYKPEYEEFMDYLENLKLVTKTGVKIKNQSKDSFIVRALNELYRNTDEEVLVNIKKDETLNDLVEQLREIRDDICYHNIRLIRSISKLYQNRGLSLQDLDQEGSIGLTKAINKFDSTRNLKFSTYAVNWIKQAVRRALANEGTTIRLPVHLYERANKIRKARRLLREQEEIDEPNIDEIYQKCLELGFDLTYEQIQQYLDADLKSTPVSTDKYVGEEEDTSLIEFLSSESDERPEEFAEKRDARERVNKILDDIASGKLNKKNEGLKNPIEYKQITLFTIKGEPIKFILLVSEYNDLRKELKGEDRKEKFIEFLSKYSIDPDSLSSAMKVDSIYITSNEREVMIYRYRTGLSDDFSDLFLERRNYNESLFNSGAKEVLTLDKTGKLFGVTRERIRQIEAKVVRKIDFYSGKKQFKSNVKCEMNMGTAENVYTLLGVSRTNKDYTIIVKPNPTITVNEYGDIIPLADGVARVYLKNLLNGVMRELLVVVHKPVKESLISYAVQRRTLTLKLDENKKDNQ